MTPPEPAASASQPASVIRGGPVLALFARLGMAPDQPTGALRLAALLLAVTWLPTAVLAAVQGLLLPGASEMPLLQDPTIWARGVFGLIALILLGPLIEGRTAPAIEELRRLAQPEGGKEFESALRSFARLSDSWIPDLVMLSIAGFTSWVALHAGSAIVTPDWRTVPATGAPSLARVWSAAVALPIFQFALMRWAWRIFLWWRFLAGVSRARLQLLPTHPDGMGGLGFLGEAQSAFFLLASPLALIFATRVVIASMRAHEQVSSYETPAAAFVVLCAVGLIGPALSFAGQLIKARRRAIFEYGRLGQSYVSQFDEKWVHGGAQGEALLGTPDLQSLADIANSMKVVREMKVFPYERRHLIVFAACVALPVFPPLLLVMPLREILLRVASIVAK